VRGRAVRSADDIKLHRDAIFALRALPTRRPAPALWTLPLRSSPVCVRSPAKEVAADK
jgi:hypothetical protein